MVKLYDCINGRDYKFYYWSVTRTHEMGLDYPLSTLTLSENSPVPIKLCYPSSKAASNASSGVDCPCFFRLLIHSDLKEKVGV